jgi:hypothetical protein
MDRSVAGRALVALVALIAMQASRAQIDISLHSTSVPDSFEVRLMSNSGVYQGSMDLIFTLRWESAAGGILAAPDDVGSDCSRYTLSGNGPEGVVNVGLYNYFTFTVFMFQNLGAQCPITTVEQPIGGFRINGLIGCRHVGIVNDAYTAGSNKDYYIAISGNPLTGQITTGPIECGGPCTPCTDPPEITSTSGNDLGYCTGISTQLDLSVTATGAGVNYVWTSPLGFFLGATPTLQFMTNIPGDYTVIVFNDCGSDTAVVSVNVAPCEPPTIDSLTSNSPVPPCGSLMLTMGPADPCAQTQWVGPGTSLINDETITVTTPVAGPYSVVMTNACGSDTATVVVTLDGTGCVPPVIASATSNSPIEIGNDLALSTSLTGSCPTLIWTGPEIDDAAVIPADSILLFEAFESGTYAVVAVNACGSDTATVNVEIWCDTAAILWVHNSGPTCLGDPVALTSDVVGSEPLNVNWVSPEGILIPAMWGDAEVENVPGIYTLVAQNLCGIDSAESLVEVDTTGVGTCEPPVVISISGDHFPCAGETLVITADVTAAGPCLHFDWSAPGNDPPMAH